MTDVNFPSVTLCNAHGLDTGEYVRNVFNNLEFNDVNGSMLLREEFRMVLGDIVFDPYAESVYSSDVLSNFMDIWLRCTITDTLYLKYDNVSVIRTALIN